MCINQRLKQVKLVFKEPLDKISLLVWRQRYLKKSQGLHVSARVVPHFVTQPRGVRYETVVCFGF